jgi:hypothetical protein
MNRKTRYLAAILAAFFVIMLAASGAQALRSLSLVGETNVKTEGNLRFGGEGLPRSTEITCEVTLLRTLSRVIPKIEGTLIGKVTGVAIDIPRCRHGENIRTVNNIIAHRDFATLTSSCTGVGIRLCDVTTANNLWKLVFRSILGTLPRITGLLFTLKSAQFTLDVTDILGGHDVCGYEGDQPALAELNAEGVITGGRILLEMVSMTARRLGGISCTSPGRLGGTFTIRNGPRVNLI